jgi:hypothetical protein
MLRISREEGGVTTVIDEETPKAAESVDFEELEAQGAELLPDRVEMTFFRRRGGDGGGGGRGGGPAPGPA